MCKILIIVSETGISRSHGLESGLFNRRFSHNFNSLFMDYKTDNRIKSYNA